MDKRLQEHIRQILDKNITRIQRLSGGMISEVARLEFDNHQSLVAKYGSNSHDLTIEAYMLNYLKTNSNLPVPAVIHAEPTLLLMDYVDASTGLNATTQAQLGKLLAELHQTSGTHYGLEHDTLIGPIHQPNPQSDSWIEFFRQNRLLYMANIALKSGYLPKSLYERIQTLTTQLDQFLIEPDNPVLIHGDMWTTNILVRDNNVVGIIDPALYYAHNEMELAYMTLFGSVSQDFFNSYTAIQVVDSEFFETRRHVYNLYPLLVHVTIFGIGYTSHVQSTLDHLGI